MCLSSSLKLLEIIFQKNILNGLSFNPPSKHCFLIIPEVILMAGKTGQQVVKVLPAKTGDLGPVSGIQIVKEKNQLSGAVF